MVEARPYTMVIGCGEKGAAWIANKHAPYDHFIGLDSKELKIKSALIIRGDVFSLPIRTGSIAKIHADFIVNGLIDREIAAPQIAKNPDVLDTNYFPPLVRRWFVESLSRSHDSVRADIRKVGALLRTVALREMWRVLANNGKLQVLDLQKNINWIAHFAPQIIDESIEFMEMKPLSVSMDDLSRSSSLEKFINRRNSVQKIELTKKHPSIGARLPLEGFPPAKR